VVCAYRHIYISDASVQGFLYMVYRDCDDRKSGVPDLVYAKRHQVAAFLHGDEARKYAAYRNYCKEKYGTDDILSLPDYA
jgi:hypothetical protein